MKLLLIFDGYADVIDVPVFVVNNKGKMKKKFLNWLYNSKNNHKYWGTIRTPSGETFTGVCYGSEAFIEWLNSKVLLNNNGQIASLVESGLVDYQNLVYPSIFF